MKVHPVPSQMYPSLLSLIPEQPETLRATALLHTPRPEVTVSVDDLAHPTVVVVDQREHDAGGTESHAVTIAGTMNEGTLTAYLRALSAPAIIVLPPALAALLPRLLPEVVARPLVTFAPPAETDLAAVFPATPPGGMRRLRAADARSLAMIPATFWGAYGTAGRALSDGIAYARYLRAEIVSLACVTARTGRYAEISTFTIERARGNDFARDCVARLVGAVSGEWGVAPMLSGAADDEETRAIAHAIGLTQEHPWTAYAWA